MSRDDLLHYRKELIDHLNQLEHQGDFDAHAASIRKLASTVLVILDQLVCVMQEMDRADAKSSN